MGQLIDGRWTSEDAPPKTGGAFERPSSPFRNWITPDGAAGPSGRAGFAAEPGRYHLYISRGCPWAHRTAIVRALKGLESMIGLSVTHWLIADQGWNFADGPGVVPDSINGCQAAHQLYSLADPTFTGRATVPILWDRKTGTIVNNESAEIMRMLGSAFDGLGAKPVDLYPAALASKIDEVNARVYQGLNNGVYRAGFATSQPAYDGAVIEVFDTLDWMESVLADQAYLCGDSPTEADWRALPTLLRFDPVYVTHFKCNLRRLTDYPALMAYTGRLLAVPGIIETVDLDHIRHTYYESHRKINPNGIVPIGFPPHPALIA